MTAFMSRSVLLRTVEENRERGIEIAGVAFLYFSMLPQTDGPYTLHAAKVILIDYKTITPVLGESVWYCSLAVQTDNPDVYVKLDNLRLKNIMLKGYLFDKETYELCYSPEHESSHFVQCDGTGDIDKLMEETFQRVDRKCRTEWLKLNKPKLSLVSSKEQ